MISHTQQAAQQAAGRFLLSHRAAWEARCPLTSMLSSAPQPAQSWISAGVLAFSSPRPRPNANKDEPASAACSGSSSLVHSTPLLLPGYNSSSGRLRKRCDPATATTTTPTSVLHSRQGGLSCLRGGSDSGGSGGSGSMKKDSQKKTAAAAGSENDNGGNQQRQQRQQQQRTGIAGADGGGKGFFGGVALVTERSTATGGSTDRRCYSVLPDGTLQVGRAQQQQQVSKNTCLSTIYKDYIRRCTLTYYQVRSSPLVPVVSCFRDVQLQQRYHASCIMLLYFCGSIHICFCKAIAWES